MHYCVERHPMIGSRAVGELNTFWESGDILKIGFIGSDRYKRDFVKNIASEWLNHVNLTFEWDAVNPVIRISFLSSAGSWSYVGTKCRHIPKNLATMNFGWLDRAVILHEFGHALGLGHEHQNPDGGIQWNEQAVIKDLSGPPNNWSESEIRFNVLSTYKEEDVLSTKLDPDSIMMYPFPATWTKNGFGTKFNQSISKADIEFVSKLYPKSIGPEEIRLAAFKKVFTSSKDVRRMNEESIVALGHILGANTDKSYLKSVNVKLVWEKLKA